MLCSSWSQNMNKAEQNNPVLHPPASPMNKYTDTSLNMPKGSYHIQLSNGCWYIIQVLCSHSDTLTPLNKSLICLNELNVHGVMLEFTGMNSLIPKCESLLFFNSHTCLYGMWVWVRHPWVCLTEGQFPALTVFTQHSILLQISYYKMFLSPFLPIKNKLWPIFSSCIAIGLTDFFHVNLIILFILLLFLTLTTEIPSWRVNLFNSILTAVV